MAPETLGEAVRRLREAKGWSERRFRKNQCGDGAGEQRRRKRRSDPARLLRLLKGGEDRKRDPRQDLLELRQRMQRTPVEVAKPGIHQMGMGETWHASERRGSADKTDREPHAANPTAARKK